MSGDLRDAIVDAAIAWAKGETHDVPLLDAVRAWEKQIERERSQWIETFWKYVIDGDEIRFDHRVVGCVESAGTVGEWHVDPRSNTYRPTPLKHFLIPIRIAGRPGILQVDPNAPIEIMMGMERRAVWELQRAVGATPLGSDTSTGP